MQKSNLHPKRMNKISLYVWGLGLGFGGVVIGLVGCTYTHLLKINSLNSL